MIFLVDTSYVAPSSCYTIVKWMTIIVNVLLAWITQMHECHFIPEYSNRHDYCNPIPESNSGHDITNRIM